VALVYLLIGLLADVVFESAAAKNRTFQAEMSRYIAERGFAPGSRTRPAAR